MTQKEIEDAEDRARRFIKSKTGKEPLALEAASKYAATVVADFYGIEQLPEAIREANQVRRELTKRLAKKK